MVKHVEIIAWLIINAVIRTVAIKKTPNISKYEF